MNTIYAIRAVGDEAIIYIGYTTDFYKRKITHRSACKCESNVGYNSPIYKYIRENGGIDKYEFIVLEESNDDIRFKENEYTEKYGLDNLLNALGGNTGLSAKEYRKNYYKERRDKYNVYQAEWREKNNEKYKSYSGKYKVYQAEWREKNKDKLTEQRQANKEETNKKHKEKFNCEICGGSYTYANKGTHLKTKKHISSLA